MELVTAVLGDHGQRLEDYGTVVLSMMVKSLNILFLFEHFYQCNAARLVMIRCGKSEEISDIIFAAFDVLCEEGTATPVCKALDEVADISVPGSKDHIKVQGEILEGLVARIVSHESSKHMEKVLKAFPLPTEEAGLDLGPNLRDICATNRSDEKQIGLGMKLVMPIQEVQTDLFSQSSYNLILLILQLPNCRHKPGLWPLYRGFFIDINLFKANKETAAEIAKNNMGIVDNGTSGGLGKDGLADEDANLMIKLKFLTYKLRTFLIRNGLSILFKEGPAAYKAYYLRQMKSWGTSAGKQRELSKMLDEWAVYIRRKCGNKQLSSSIYLSEAEPFLEQYAERSPQNQALIGSAGNLVRAEDFLAIVEGGGDEEGDLEAERKVAPLSPTPSSKDSVQKDEGLIVFFPGIPGCAKSALCKELLNAPGGFGDDRPVQSLMGDLIKGKYWQKVADERRRKPYSIMLADKNAPNAEVWRQIEDMCHSTRASAVPVVPDSEGTDSNPFSLDALAVFMFECFNGNLDKASSNAGYSRGEFEGDLIERFGSLVQMPLLKPDRSPLPDPVKSVLEEGISLYKLHANRHGRLESTKGSYSKEWAKWEQQLREVLVGNAEYLNSVQVPFDFAVKEVSEQLAKIAKGDYITPDTGKRKFGTIVYAAVSLPVMEIKGLLDNLAEENPKAEAFLKDKHLENSLAGAHVTLAHKRSHGVIAVANYGMFLHKKVPVDVTALLFTDRMAAFEAILGSVDGERIVSKNEWPHITLWTGEGVAAKEANALPELLSEGKATWIEINPPATIFGTLEFY
ncbi:hypothetical protein FNV43_RR04431 [Rhamnella rubrinervis]|uniref:tRNA ligase phosphodiesterase domain-containing protein n=1 Tax=Rhamnella rubrinervis TaxID=2594499 RepID=A0A8K0HLX1_9ROSA|nr:hypothetical protein FNV43_RR04431 [Rhamnella rubrinervis]